MTWQPSEDHVALFAPNKQRSAAYTLERRSLRAAMLDRSNARGRVGLHPAEPCLADRRQVKNMVLFSQATRADGQRLRSTQQPLRARRPALSRTPEPLRSDRSKRAHVGLILHRKAKLDGRNVVAFLEAFEGREALKELLEPLADAVAGRQIQEPQAEGERADQVLPRTTAPAGASGGERASTQRPCLTPSAVTWLGSASSSRRSSGRMRMICAARRRAQSRA